jgi:hypothetical protein
MQCLSAMTPLILFLGAVGCLNNDRTVMSKQYAWRPLGLLPILKATAMTNNNLEGQRYRRLDLYHRCMDIVVAEINELCSVDKHFRFADGKVRLGRCFWHLLSMDGLEIAATTMCPAGTFHDTRRHTEVSLAFFSTFEPVNLTSGSVMQREGVPMFYDSASSSALPSLYISPVKNVMGHVPLIPCFVEGNTHPTIPHRFGRLGRHVLGEAAADSRQDAGNGSRLYELHPWMWRYGRGHARKVSIVKSMEARARRLREARVRASVPVKRRKAASAARAAAD